MSKTVHLSFFKRPQTVLLAILIVACTVRALPAVHYGQDWYYEGSFTLINFDEAGSCRAALGGFDYTPWVGWQTLALADALGLSPPAEIYDDARAVKAFCHSEAHIVTARLYSAVTGALTVVALWILAALLFPTRPLVAPVASALLALSGWHISESMVGTVDAPSTFFIYSFIAAVAWALRRGGGRWVMALLLLVPALWAKYWVFALVALAALIPAGNYAVFFAGISRLRAGILLLAYSALFGLVCTPDLLPGVMWSLPVLFYGVVPWSRMGVAAKVLMLAAPWFAPLLMQVELFAAFTAAGVEGRFGSDYGAIGWHKWLRNPLNIPIVLIVGLGLPGFLLALFATGRLWKSASFNQAWLALLPLLVFALYMAFLAPVTYYRHYLPLLPAACLLAALGLSYLNSSLHRPALVVMLCWQVLLAVDLVTDYHLDPRRNLPGWYAEQQPTRVLVSYYVSPPPGTGTRHSLFRPESAPAQDKGLSQGDALILSENWYDTAFANELNGPLVNDTAKLIKTTPKASAFYRQALAGENPFLTRREHYRVPSYMPELRLHVAAYGSFTQFVGDIVIFEVSP